MIERLSSNSYNLQCDFCDTYENFTSFNEAVEYKKSSKWKCIKLDGEFYDKCPNHDNNDE